MRAPVDRPIIDVHTHVLAAPLPAAARAGAAPERGYPSLDDHVARLAACGVQRFIASCYAPQPGMARELNRWNAGLVQRYPQAVPFGTFHPLDDVEGLAEEAFGELGLAGFEIHCAAQRCFPDDPGLLPAYRAAEEARKVCLIHCSRAPVPSPYADARRLERVLRRYPGLTVVVAHMGADQYRRYLDLLAVYDNLYLETSLTFIGALEREPPVTALIEFQDRVLFGSGFPDPPADLDAAVRSIPALELGRGIEDKILYANAARLLEVGPLRRWRSRR